MGEWRGLFTLPFFILFVTLLSSCEDPGSVGGALIPTNANIIGDTLYVDSVGTEQVSARSGRLTFMSTGVYNDQLFGRIQAVGLLRPSLGDVGIDTLTADQRISLRILLNQENVWGDSTASVTYEIKEISESWEQSTISYDSDVAISNSVVGSFTVTDEDSITVVLSEEWQQKYRQAYNDTMLVDDDSLYKANMPGLAISARTSGKIMPFRRTSKFLITSGDTLTFSQDISASGTVVDREEVTFEGYEELTSTISNVLTFDMRDFADQIEPTSLAQAQLQLVEADARLRQTLPDGHRRPTYSSPRFFISTVEEVVSLLPIPTNLEASQRFFSSSADSVKRADIVVTLNQFLLDSSLESSFVVFLGLNNGILRSSLFATDAVRFKSPRLVYISTEPEFSN